MSSESCWRTRVTDKLRELLYPALVLSIVSSVWVIGYVREKEARLGEAYAAPDADMPMTWNDDEPNGGAALLEGIGMTPSAAPTTPATLPYRGAFTSVAE